MTWPVLLVLTPYLGWVIPAMKVEKYLCWYAAEKRILFYILLWSAVGRIFFKKDIGLGNVKTVGISLTTSIHNKSAKKY